MEASSVCIVDASGKILREAKVLSQPDNLIGWFRDLGLEVTRIGLEAGPLSQWLYTAMKKEGLAVELLETRHVHDAFKVMPVKMDEAFLEVFSRVSGHDFLAQLRRKLIEAFSKHIETDSRIE